MGKTATVGGEATNAFAESWERNRERAGGSVTTNDDMEHQVPSREAHGER